MPGPISTWVAEALAVLAKEWRSELRTRYALNAIGLFAVTTLVVISLTLGPAGTEDSARRTVLPVLLWIILLFAASTGLPRAFAHEEETGTALALRLATRPSALLCGKMLYNLSLLLALELLITPLYCVLLEVPVASAWRLALALAVGGYGLAVGSTLIAAIVGQARAQSALFAVLAFPVLLPLLVFSIELTRAALLAEPASVALSQAILYDATLTVVSWMLFPVIWNP